MENITKRLPDSGYEVEIRFTKMREWEQISKRGPIIDVKATPGSWYAADVLGLGRFGRPMRDDEQMSLDAGQGWNLSLEDTRVLVRLAKAAYDLWVL